MQKMVHLLQGDASRRPNEAISDKVFVDHVQSEGQPVERHRSGDIEGEDALAHVLPYWVLTAIPRCRATTLPDLSI